MGVRQLEYPRSVAVLGNYLPRRCGIATFTTDLCEALAGALGPDGDVFALAMDDLPEGYPYPDRVRFELRANVLSDYSLAADFLNINQAGIVILQHEYGIFGGPSGAHVLRLLRELRMPIVATLHTVLSEPGPDEKAVMEELAQLADRLVVMSDRAFGMLGDIYGVPEHKIAHIHHGIPDVSFVDPSYHKDRFGVEGKKVILTFGLLSPNKGIEVMIRAMSEIVERHPDVVYIVLGATHPNIKREKGEEYRQTLQRMVRDLGLAKNVVFHNRFVSLDELVQYIGAADIYATPYLSEKQITSGTLAYAVGAGKAVVSTPYWYAKEMLADGRGVLVPFGDAGAMAAAVNELLENETERHAMRKRAYQYCRSMVWGEIARQYLEVAAEVVAERAEMPRPFVPLPVLKAEEAQELPDPDLRHLRNLTDDTGIFQHAVYSAPERAHGYCTDDVSRALIVAALYWQLRQDDGIVPLIHTYMAFMNDAFNEETGRFRNFLSFDRKWLDDGGSNDCHGRALWGLGVLVANCPTDALLAHGVRLFSTALPLFEEMDTPRSLAFGLVGIHAYLGRFGGDAAARRMRGLLAERLHECFARNAARDWPWCENQVTYANAKLPQALLLSGQWIPDGRMADMGLRSLEWLLKIQTADNGHLSIIGNEGWMARDGSRANFDQQPLEASNLVEACVEAYRVTQDEKWLVEAQRCFEWFLGKNDLNAVLYDFQTGGCRDGLHAHGPNLNQGAESTLAWLIALLVMESVIGEKMLGRPARQAREDQAQARQEEPVGGEVG